MKCDLKALIIVV